MTPEDVHILLRSRGIKLEQGTIVVISVDEENHKVTVQLDGDITIDMNHGVKA